MAREAVGAALGGGIACLACPSLFQHLRAEAPGARTHLLEYDPRFEVGLRVCVGVWASVRE